jgi:hypothetical protein
MDIYENSNIKQIVNKLFDYNIMISINNNVHILDFDYTNICNNKINFLVIDNYTIKYYFKLLIKNLYIYLDIIPIPICGKSIELNHIFNIIYDTDETDNIYNDSICLEDSSLTYNQLIVSQLCEYKTPITMIISSNLKKKL